MNCRAFRNEIRMSVRPGDEALRHAALCPACAAEARAAALLRLGSERADDATPRPGFEQRLLARLAAEGRGARTSAWNGGFELLVRPALAVAAALVLVCGGLYATAPEADGDLASLVETDAVYYSALALSPEAILAVDPAAGSETP